LPRRQEDDRQPLEAALPLFRRLGRELPAAPGELQRELPMPMASANGVMRREYRFAHCVLDVERRELWMDGRRQTLAPKPFDVLLYLNRHRLETQDELLDTVWRKAVASPEVITQAIAKIRQAMRRSKTPTVRVETVYRKGVDDADARARIARRRRT